MKKIKLNYIFIILWIIITFIWNYFYQNFFLANNSTNISQNISSVSSWSIIKSIDTNWSTTLANEQSLSFNQTWKVKNVYFKEWDSIKSWDVIARLDDTDWQNNVKQAKINLENSKISLNSLYEDVDASKILQSQNSIEITQKSIDVAKKELENMYNNKSITINDLSNNLNNLNKELNNLNDSLSQAQSDLDLTQKSNENSLNITKENQINTINQIQNDFLNNLTQISQIIEKQDIMLGVSDTNKKLNDEYEIFLWAKNMWNKNESITKLSTLISEFDVFQNKIKNLDNSTLTIDDNIKIIQEFIKFYDNLINFLDLSYQTVIDSVETTQLTNSMIENFKTNINNYKNTSISKISNLNSSINSLKTLSNTNLIDDNYQSSYKQKQQSIETIKLNIEKKKQEILSSEKNIDIKSKEIELNIETKINSISNLEKTLEINKKSYDELLVWPKSLEIQKAQNSIKQSEINLENAYKTLEKYEIIAPFDWVIRKIDYKEGDNILSDSDKSIYIENPNLIEIIVYLDQVDIINIDKNNKVYVTFDWYSSYQVEAKISKIDTTPITNSWVVTYKVVIVLEDKKFDKKLLSWMTANVEIITKELKNVLLLDSSYITNENSNYYVKKISWNKIEKTNVTIWEVNDWKTQILSWLKIWDKVVKEVSSSSWKTSNKSSSLLNIWWQNSNRSWWWMSWWWAPPF